MNILTKIIIISFMMFNISYGQNSLYIKDSLVYNTTSTTNDIRRDNSKSIFFKAGIGLPLFQQSSISSNFKSLSVDASLEYRVLKSTFITAGLETVYSFGSKVEMFNLNLPVAIRQYFSIRGKSTNSAKSIFRQYIALQTHSSLFSNFFYDRSRIDLDRYYRGMKASAIGNTSTIINTGQYLEGPNLLEYAYLRLGSQFKIKKSNYLDVSVVVPVKQLVYNKNYNGFTLASPAFLSIKYGLVISE